MYLNLIITILITTLHFNNIQYNYLPIINVSKQDTLNKNFEIKIIHYHPYCGGAAPTPEQLKNRYSPEINDFVLINTNTNDTIYFSTNNRGIATFNLYPGQYIIKEKYKIIPFKDFYKKYFVKSDNFAESQGIQCYKKWWQSNLTKFEITRDTRLLKLEVTISESCFTGKNPCLKFIGPPPP